MHTDLVKEKFEKIGARAKVRVNDLWRRNVTVDIRRDGQGEFFDIILNNKDIEMHVLDAQPVDRHLLLMIRDPDNPKARFLCGHD